MRVISQFLQFLIYLFRAKDEHSIHSPFVFDLYTNIIKEAKPYYAFANIESIRAKYLLESKSISVTDFGTGNSSKRRISTIASRTLKKPKSAELLFRLANYFSPSNILELGTSLGITTSYLASANSKSQIHTLEGCPEIAAIASQTFKTLKLDNVNLTIGSFDENLESVLSSIPSLDFIFIDGNHRKEPTIKYFQACLKASNDKTVFIIDDIHWSAEMNEAWLALKQHPKVTISIDLFDIGILILSPNSLKQDFILRF